ncbi:MgtC/SapB family protein [Mucilaginibacter sp. L3T2-6]|uniref:MgtC/SapB family protein n=1 Tax=Mucilaginibacter sp. L3T2-6 TaxID=3062491 RepID=UPI002674DFED|nr:MgtC/SapB family protein [Mucilaginibacter sp. L3T2-6]MDO3643023.1 MgtC/SapB family protein [Mucilaginibacter sp. L3T2-6]MDV6215790.1 MgtC/SapB family protein [Mucilaginibacter sp. L3T2-6]
MTALEFDITTQDLIKVATAVICGGLLGAERQYKNKIAGFRTIILICMGSTIYTMVAQWAGAGVNINIVTGIGFIGAGVIFKDSITVNGLTTAAVIWISAAIGMAAGSGNHTLALICTGLTLAVLLLFNLVERYIDKVHRDKLFVIVFTDADYANIEEVENIVNALDLTSRRLQVAKFEGCLKVALLVTGHRADITLLDKKLLAMPVVKSF